MAKLKESGDTNTVEKYTYSVMEQDDPFAKEMWQYL